jgi:hypothetical protein
MAQETHPARRAREGSAPVKKQSQLRGRRTTRFLSLFEKTKPICTLQTQEFRRPPEYSIFKQPWADASNTLRRREIGAYFKGGGWKAASLPRMAALRDCKQLSANASDTFRWGRGNALPI